MRLSRWWVWASTVIVAVFGMSLFVKYGLGLWTHSLDVLSWFAKARSLAGDSDAVRVLRVVGDSIDGSGYQWELLMVVSVVGDIALLVFLIVMVRLWSPKSRKDKDVVEGGDWRTR